MATSIYQKRLLERRKENGQCIDCGNMLDRDGVRCVECNMKHNEKTNADRKWYKENGICPRCRKNTLFSDENMCPECSAKMYEANIRSIKRLGREHCNYINAESRRKNYAKRVELGICTRCGKRQADYNFKTCGICRNKTKLYKQGKYGKPSRSERVQIGLCYFCDNPVKDGYKVCEKHYQMNLEKARSEKANEARKILRKEGVLY